MLGDTESGNDTTKLARGNLGGQQKESKAMYTINAAEE